MSSVTNLSVEIDGIKEEIPFSNLSQSTIPDDFVNRVKKSTSTVIRLADYPTWPPKARFNMIEYLVHLEKFCSLQFDNANGVCKDLFEAALKCFPETDDIAVFQNAREALLEIVVLKYSTALEEACNRILKRMRDAGIKGTTQRTLVQQAKKLLAELDKGDAAVGTKVVPVTDIFQNAPVPEGMVVPAGWKLGKDGIAKGSGPIFASTPIVIAARQIEVDSSSQSLTLYWLKSDQWKKLVVERAALATPKAIIEELAPYGVAVHHNNSKDFIQYLSDFETANEAHIACIYVTDRLGWQNGTDQGFLLGQTLISPGGSLESLVSDPPPDQQIIFRGRDLGDDQIAGAFSTAGEIDQWLEMLSSIKEYPKLMLAVFASLSAPFLKIFNSPNFLVSFAGQTSCGKTTALRLAASCWGDPSEQNSASILKTWSGTKVWLERFSAVLNNLPLVLDDTKHARHPDDVAKAIYDVYSGVGRGRGTVKGLAQQASWSTVAITSGEQPLTSFTEDGGTHSRVLSLWGSPFGSNDAADLVHQVDSCARANFGHAGLQLVQYAINNQDQWDLWRDEYRIELNKFQDWAKTVGNPFAARMASHFAAIVTTAWIAHHAFDLAWNYTDPIEPLWDELVEATEQADQAKAALARVVDWAHQNRHQFTDGKKKVSDKQHCQIVGRWDAGGCTNPALENEKKHKLAKISFIPEQLRHLLASFGYDASSILRTWRERGYLELDNDLKHFTKKVQLFSGESPFRLVVIRRSAVYQVQI